MTREQIREKIEETIDYCCYVDSYGNEVCGIQAAVEEIMKLWDQGFTYELRKDE